MANNTTKQRVNFASIQKQMPFPDFLEIQLKSFHDFFQMDSSPEQRRQEGLYKVFSENFPIEDTRNNFVLEFLDYYIDRPRYSIQECLQRGLTYSVPLKAKLKLYCTDPDHEDFATEVQDVYSRPRQGIQVPSGPPLPRNFRERNISHLYVHLTILLPALVHTHPEDRSLVRDIIYLRVTEACLLFL